MGDTANRQGTTLPYLPSLPHVSSKDFLELCYRRDLAQTGGHSANTAHPDGLTIGELVDRDLLHGLLIIHQLIVSILTNGVGTTQPVQVVIAQKNAPTMFHLHTF